MSSLTNCDRWISCPKHTSIWQLTPQTEHAICKRCRFATDDEMFQVGALILWIDPTDEYVFNQGYQRYAAVDEKYVLVANSLRLKSEITLIRPAPEEKQ